MPWDITIIAKIDSPPDSLTDVPDNVSIGTLEMVRTTLERVLPGVQFYREPSGKEKLEIMQRTLPEIPDVIRRNIIDRPATTQADYEGKDFSYRFYFYDQEVVKQIVVEVRGSGDPISNLHSIAKQTGWLLYENAGNTRLDFSGADGSHKWKSFRSYIRKGVKESGTER